MDIIQSLNEGFIKTLLIFVYTLLGALPLGLIIALFVLGKNKIIKGFFDILIWIIRGTPLMLQLLVIYYGPGLLLNNNIWNNGNGRFYATLTAFIINYACYFAEIFRGGIDSIPKGQEEAGLVLGMNKTQVFFKVILLQVVKNILPAMSNEIITLVKDTSLARTISVYEIIWNGQSFIKARGLIWPLFFTGIYYLVFCGILTIIFNRLEKKLDYFGK